MIQDQEVHLHNIINGSRGKRHKTHFAMSQFLVGEDSRKHRKGGDRHSHTHEQQKRYKGSLVWLLAERKVNKLYLDSLPIEINYFLDVALISLPSALFIVVLSVLSSELSCLSKQSPLREYTQVSVNTYRSHFIIYVSGHADSNTEWQPHSSDTDDGRIPYIAF